LGYCLIKGEIWKRQPLSEMVIGSTVFIKQIKVAAAKPDIRVVI